jgi:hypothetical protein
MNGRDGQTGRDATSKKTLVLASMVSHLGRVWFLFYQTRTAASWRGNAKSPSNCSIFLSFHETQLCWLTDFSDHRFY